MAARKRGEIFARSGRVDLFAGQGVAAAMAVAETPAMPELAAAHMSSPDHRAPAGGRSSNARPDGIGHTRGNLHGAQTKLGDADFLERVSLAEQHDAEASSGCSPAKGRGVCNPLVEYMPASHTATGGVQLMPNMGGHYDDGSKNVGAAGQASSATWRGAHNYMANGAEAYGDFRSEHLALQQSSRKAQAAAGSPGAHRHLQTESKVVFSGSPGGLYPGSPSMIKGKFPGY